MQHPLKVGTFRSRAHLRYPIERHSPEVGMRNAVRQIEGKIPILIRLADSDQVRHTTSFIGFFSQRVAHRRSTVCNTLIDENGSDCEGASSCSSATLSKTSRCNQRDLHAIVFVQEAGGKPDATPHQSRSRAKALFQQTPKSPQRITITRHRSPPCGRGRIYPKSIMQQFSP